MAKVLLVEDDNNLREIYEARLAAEGYEIVSAQDGEAALSVAKTEQPDLVISDVMMPRVSGFEMLDILRNTQGLKDVKVIMLTALGQAEDQARATGLGADRYLVKSQVTLEDIVKAAAELLGGEAAAQAAAAAPAAAAPDAAAPAPAAPAPDPAPTAVPVAEPAVATPAPAPAAPVATPEPAAPAPTVPVAAPPADPIPTPAPAPPVATSTPAPAPVLSTPPAPTTPAAPAASDGDAVLADAVKDLLDGAAAPPAPVSTVAPPVPPPSDLASDAPAATPVASVATPSVTPAPTPTAPAPEPAVPAPTPPAAVPDTPNPVPRPVDSDSITQGGQRIIQPLPSTGATPNPDLNALLEKEGINSVDHDNSGLTSPHTPGHVISPNGGGAPAPADNQALDPNKISL